MSEAHAKALAPKLLTAYKDLVANGTLHKDLLPTEASLVVGLLRLVKDEFLTENNLKKAAAAPRQADWLKIVEVAAKAAQKYSGLSMDGVIAGKTIQWLQFAKRCHDKLKKNGIGSANPNATFGKHEFRYFIEPEVVTRIDSVNVPQLLEGAFAGWRRVAEVITSRTSNPGDANVVVKVVSIDGASNVLADAHVGPPHGNQQLELRFDISETWATTKFLTTASHEIGHLLGLTHIGTIGHLMNPTLGDVAGPTFADGKRLITELGYNPTPEFEDLPEQTPDEFIPMWNLIDPNQPQ
jgi:hypothetical protein